VDGPVSVAILDLDNFKAVNDDFGHAAGDRVLVRTAALLRAGVRPTDTLARSGGEEFVLLMPGTGEQAAAAVCARMLAALRGETWRRIGDGLTVTASIGVATAAGDGPIDFEALTTLADQRLYAAKRHGRDRIAGADT
jgi:diguanylate cyclase (GGDEF)-like protein